jgi:hypothetical protein
MSTTRSPGENDVGVALADTMPVNDRAEVVASKIKSTRIE